MLKVNAGVFGSKEFFEAILPYLVELKTISIWSSAHFFGGTKNDICSVTRSFSDAICCKNHTLSFGISFASINLDATPDLAFARSSFVAKSSVYAT